MKSQHYARIHARVTRKVWGNLPRHDRDIIASDSEHTTATYKWFENKVANDTERLYQDPEYYDNSEFSFKMPRSLRA